MFYPIINGKCIISEISQVNHLKNSIIESDSKSLTDTIEYICSDNRWYEFGLSAKHKFKQKTELWLQNNTI